MSTTKRTQLESLVAATLRETLDTFRPHLGNLDNWPQIRETITEALERVLDDEEPVAALIYCRELFLHIASIHIKDASAWNPVKKRMLKIMSDQRGAIYRAHQVLSGSPYKVLNSRQSQPVPHGGCDDRQE